MALSPKNTKGKTAEHLSSPKYRPDIDGLRAVAVLLVVAYHAFPEAVKGGFIGVDVFFVISGFLISTIVFENMEAHRFSIVEFYCRRIRRIFPALILVLASCLAAGWLLLLGPDYALLGKHVAGGAGFSANILLWLEADYFDVKAELKPLLHLWSLGIEEQYYLVWPLLIWALWKPGRNLAIPLLVMLAVSFALNIVHTLSDKTLAFYSPLSRFWEILMGSLLAYETFRRRGLPTSTTASVYAQVRSTIGIGLIILGLLVTTKTSPFPGWRALLPTMGAALIISAGPMSWFNSWVLSRRLFVWVGLISFPLYLWHWPLLSFARIEVGETPSLETRWILVGASFLLSILTYVLVEKPLRFGRFGNLKALLLTIILGVVGWLGYATFKAEGFPLRFPAIIRDAASFIPFAWGDHVRAEKCHLHLVTSTVHSPECFETARPLIALWGDSHAASLYPGLNKLQSSRSFGIIQINQSGCPPLIGLDNLGFRKNCKQINDALLERLTELKPDAVILHSTWWTEVDQLSDQTIHDRTADTIRILRERIPNVRIIVIGPVPRWRDNPQKVIYQAWKESLDKTKEPPIMLPAENLTNVDEALKQACAESNVRYISPAQHLCEGDRCVSRVGPTPLDILCTDDRHLSPHGSIYFIDKIKDLLF